jgi:ketosteroid isomerase-like protein
LFNFRDFPFSIFEFDIEKLNHQFKKTMKIYKIAATLTFLTVCVYSTHSLAQTSKELAEAKWAIAKSNSIYYQAFIKNDAAIFVNSYADDCIIMPPSSPTFKGTKGANEFFKVAYDKIGVRGGKFITTAVYGNGKEYVTEEGLWQLRDATGKMADDGKYLVLWKKTAKGWKMFRDSFSSNHPGK